MLHNQFTITGFTRLIERLRGFLFIKFFSKENSEIQDLRDRLSKLECLRESTERAKNEWMRKCLDLDFQSRVARGCYANCPIFK